MNAEVMLELTSADIPGALAAFANAGIAIRKLTEPNGLTVGFVINKHDLEEIQKIVYKRGEVLRQIMRLGLYWRIRNLAIHWLLLAGIVGTLLLTAWLPTKVLFIRVQGNEHLPDRLIVDSAAKCGIVFGADRGDVRSERMKNALLEALPQLQWAGINTTGCTAVITVKERSAEPDPEKSIPGNMIAICDGIIEEMTTVRGKPVKVVGQVVRAGELLISGYTDCGGVILLSGAKGEVYGRTIHQISAKTVEIVERKLAEGSVRTKISLVIGKKRINFYEDSGILDTGCVKMYSEYYLTLPGGLELPVKLLITTETGCQWTDELSAPEWTEQLLAEQARSYLLMQMTAGKIISANTSVNGCVYKGEFVCREMIGRLVYEEIIQDYGENR